MFYMIDDAWIDSLSKSRGNSMDLGFEKSFRPGVEAKSRFRSSAEDELPFRLLFFSPPTGPYQTIASILLYTQRCSMLL